MLDIVLQSIPLVGLALAFAFSNGFRDSSTIVATVVSTRTLSPRKAFVLCAVFEFVGAVFIGSAVALTIGKGIFPHLKDVARAEIAAVVASALAASFIWGVVSWWRAWPTSNNQGLFAGFVGAGLALWGIKDIEFLKAAAVLSVLIFSPILGFLLSIVLTSFLRYVGTWMTPRVQKFNEKLHIMSSMAVSLAHGSNDGQMVMGILIVALGLGQMLQINTAGEILIPIQIRVLVASSIALGVLLGGRRILKKLGMSFYQIRPPQGVSSQLTSAGTILTCALAGFPASTTQVITGSIIGAGVAKSHKSVRWSPVLDIVFGWALTIPSVFSMAFLLSLVFHYFLKG